MKKIHTLVGTAAVSALLYPLAATAATEAELDEMIVTSRFLKQRYEEQHRIIGALQKRIAELEHTLTAGLENTRGRGTTPYGEATAQAVAQVNNGHSPQVAQNAQSLPPSDPGNSASQQGGAQAQAIASTQGIPLFDRKFSIEQGLTYTHYDRRTLVLSGFLALDAILLGNIELEQIKTDQLQYDLTGRWNMSDRISMDLNVPLIYRTSNYISPGAGGGASSFSDASSSTASVGDINAGLYYQLPKKSPLDLDWIASVRVKAPTGRHPFGIKLHSADPANTNLVIPTRQPTGNGIWNTAFGLAVLKTTDPVVLFGNIGFGYNFKRGFDDLSSTEGSIALGDVKLGHTLSFGAGFALALNEKTSVSFSYSHLLQPAAKLRRVGEGWTRQVGTDVNSATFNSSLTHQLSPRLSMVGTVSIGLTPDAPDFSLGLKFPYTF